MRPLRSARAFVALALCALPTSLGQPAAADPELAFCTAVGGVCVTADPGLCAEAVRCAEPRVDATVCPAELAVCVAVSPLGGIETPATGTITITGSVNGSVTATYTGVFDQTLNHFTCGLFTPAERTVRCVPNSPGIDWYCAGWIVTATAEPFVTYNSQVAGQASCSDYQGFPSGSPPQTLYTDFANSGQTKTNQALGLAWFVNGAITCQAWGYSAGPEPMGDYSVTCNEPGANAPR